MQVYETIKFECHSVSDLVFTNDSSDHLTEFNIKKYAQLLSKAGIPYIKFHAFEHTVCSIC